jgi:hypothetical protein
LLLIGYPGDAILVWRGIGYHGTASSVDADTDLARAQGR